MGVSLVIRNIRLAKYNIKLIFSSLFLANLVSIFSILGFFNVTDSFLLSFVSNITLEMKESSEDKVVTTIGLTPEWYEISNMERSPLKRDALIDVFDRLSESNIKVLAVDVDLSPSVDLYKSSQQIMLDEKLIDLSQRLDALILPYPFPAASQELTNVKVVWLKKMCSKGVYFARATQNVNFWLGQNIGYVNDIQSIGAGSYNLAEAAFMAKNKGLPECSIETVIKNYMEGRSFTSDEHVRNMPINIFEFSKNQAIDFSTEMDFDKLTPVTILGLDNGRSDFFSIGGKTYPGYIFHGLNYVSLVNPVKRMPEISFVLDFLFSMFLIFLISYINKYEENSGIHCGVLRRGAFASIKLILFGFILAALLLIMPVMFSNGVWDNLFVVLIAVYAFLFYEKNQQEAVDNCSRYVLYTKYAVFLTIGVLDFWLIL